MRRSVRARPARLRTVSVSRLNRICMARLHGRARRVTAQNGGLRPGQYESFSPLRHVDLGAAALKTIAAAHKCSTAQVRVLPAHAEC